MRKLLLVAALALPLSFLAAGKASAHGAIGGDTGVLNLGGCFNVKIGLGGKIWAKHEHCAPSHGCCPSGGYGGGGVAPWYLYWPMDAHFQVPAPTNYPYWPPPMTPMMGSYYQPGSPISPASYGPGYGAVPYYWQGH